MKKPIIGISTGLLAVNNSVFPGHEKLSVNTEYIEAVSKACGVPIMLPIVNDEDVVAVQVAALDGIIISGGEDVNPLIYGEEPIEKLGVISTERDEYETKLLQAAFRMNKPVLGICRGAQLMNVVLGGTLYQDLSTASGSYVKHNQNAKRAVPTHTVTVKSGTRLHDILGDEVISNSFHHQAVKDVAPGMVVNAVARDGIVEGIEKPGENFVVGVQWHPEIMVEKTPQMLKIFKALVAAAGKR